MGSSNTRPEAKPQLKTFQFSPETSAPIVRSLRDAPVYYDDMEPLLGQRDQMDQNPPVVSEPNAETDSVSNSFDSPVSARIGWIDRQLVLAPTQTLLSLRHNLTKLGETFNGVWYHFGFTMAQIADLWAMRTIDLQQFLSQVDELLTNLCFRMLRINHDHPMNKFVHSFLLKVRSASKTLETNSADLIGHHLNQAFAFCHNKTNKTMQIYRVCAIILTNSLDRIYLRELESWDCQVHFVGLKLPLTRNRICHELTLQFSNPDHDAFIIVHQGPANPKNGNWFLESRDDSLENDKRNGNLQSEFSLDALWTTYVHAMPTLCVKPINVIIDSCGSGAWVEQAKTMSLPINVIASCRRYFDFDDCGHFLRLFFRLCWPQSRNHPSCFPGVSMYNHLTREIIRPEPDEYLQLHHLWVSSLRAQSLTTAHTPWILCDLWCRMIWMLPRHLQRCVSQYLWIPTSYSWMEPPPFISLNASPPLEPELMFNMVSPFFQQPQLVTKMIPREPFWGKGTRQSRVDWLRREAHLLLVLTGLQQTQYLLPLHNVVIVRDPLHYNSFCDPRHSDTYLSSLLDYGSNPSDVKTLEHEWNGQDWQRKLNLLVQCARAVQELHSGGFPSIVHCNLSPDKFVVLPKDQVLLRGLEYAGICYCNSNEATVYDRLRQPRNAACCSPEQLCIYETVRYLGEDIWGLGGILVYMVEGKYLRTKSRNDEIKPDLQSVPSIFRKEYIQMVNGCLETYPGQRWPLQRLVRTLETMESAWNAFDTYFPDNKYLMPALRSIILAFLD